VERLLALHYRLVERILAQTETVETGINQSTASTGAMGGAAA
jgi:hypothetical protein